jgi:metal-responsive CopG/Arc/MetJ family transcriptional regulator
MKDLNLIVRISQEEFDDINKAYKDHISKKETKIITRSEFIRQMIRDSIKSGNYAS